MKRREYTAEIYMTVKAVVTVAADDGDEAHEKAFQEGLDIQDSIADLGLNLKFSDGPDVDLTDWDYIDTEDCFEDDDFYREEAQRDYELSLTA